VAVSTSSQADSPETTSVGIPSPQRPAFVTTQWSVVLTAGRSDTPSAQVALEKLCRAYWYPLYAYVRRLGRSVEDAQDLTQEFFARLLERNWVGTARREKGRFRSFLLTGMDRFLWDEWDKARAQKRGGGKVTFLNLEAAETKFGEQSAGNLSPDKAFERQWAVTLLEQVYERLAEEYLQAGKAKWFEALRGCLVRGGGTARYAELAEGLGMSEGAVKVAVHRLRHRYRELLRETIAETVSGPEEVEDELRYLLRTLAGG